VRLSSVFSSNPNFIKLLNQIRFYQSLRKMNKSEWGNVRDTSSFTCFRESDVSGVLPRSVLSSCGLVLSSCHSFLKKMAFTCSLRMFCCHAGDATSCVTWVSSIFSWVMRRSIWYSSPWFSPQLVDWSSSNFAWTPLVQTSLFPSFAPNLTYVKHLGHIVVARTLELDSFG
jgi:hypothetical protein